MALNWTYDNALECDVATVSDDLRIRAVRDDCPVNPFKEYDGHWPMLARVGGERETTGEYETPTGSGVVISTPFNGAALSSCRTPDALLVHDQHAFARAVGYPADRPISKMLADQGNMHDLTDCPNRVTIDAVDVLRDMLIDAMSDLSGSEQFDALEAIYKLLGIPVLNTTVTGYSQGDWTELLIVATPESQVTHWGKDHAMTPEQVRGDLAAQAELYRAWAFGDCYGYVLERAVPGDDPDDDPDWDEIDSCWGYYGSDHGDSGLEEAALESARILDKPIPTLMLEAA